MYGRSLEEGEGLWYWYSTSTHLRFRLVFAHLGRHCRLEILPAIRAGRVSSLSVVVRRLVHGRCGGGGGGSGGSGDRVEKTRGARHGRMGVGFREKTERVYGRRQAHVTGEEKVRVQRHELIRKTTGGRRLRYGQHKQRTLYVPCVVTLRHNYGATEDGSTYTWLCRHRIWGWQMVWSGLDALQSLQRATTNHMNTLCLYLRFVYCTWYCIRGVRMFYSNSSDLALRRKRGSIEVG